MEGGLNHANIEAEDLIITLRAVKVRKVGLLMMTMMTMMMMITRMKTIRDVMKAG